MSKRADPRRVRRLAMQALYQIDVNGTADLAVVFESLDEEFDPLEVREEASQRAIAAWHAREQADDLVRELAPDWPTHRQPPVDRAILRLALHEMRTGRTPVKVAINEAVDLAKQFGSEHSSSFVNAVLDKAAKRLPQPPPPPPEVPPRNPPPSADAWLRDAVRDGEG